jgi:hypothetical protein
VSGSLALFPFTISAANNRLVFFYDCHVPPELRLPLLPRLCDNRTVGAYISGRWGEGDTPPRGVPANCSSVSVPVRGGMEPVNLLYYELLMADGFLLDLPQPLGDCDGCRRVSGECRLDRLLSFMCVCPDGKLCPSFAQSNSTTHPGITRSVFSLTTLHRLFRQSVVTHLRFSLAPCHFFQLRN